MCKKFVSQCAEINENLRADITVSVIVIITVSVIVITARYWVFRGFCGEQRMCWSYGCFRDRLLFVTSLCNFLLKWSCQRRLLYCTTGSVIKNSTIQCIENWWLNFPSVICNLIHYAMNVNTCLIIHCHYELNPIREICVSSRFFEVRWT
jgi:hypothetical protein